jgi:hypothetical protein
MAGLYSAAIGAREGGERRRRAGKFLQGLPSFSKDFPNFSKLFPSFFQGFPSFFLGGFEGNQRLAVERGRIRFFLLAAPPPGFFPLGHGNEFAFAEPPNSRPIVDSTDCGFQKENVGGGRGFTGT